MNVFPCGLGKKLQLFVVSHFYEPQCYNRKVKISTTETSTFTPKAPPCTIGNPRPRAQGTTKSKSYSYHRFQLRVPALSSRRKIVPHPRNFECPMPKFQSKNSQSSTNCAMRPKNDKERCMPLEARSQSPQPSPIGSSLCSCRGPNPEAQSCSLLGLAAASERGHLARYIFLYRFWNAWNDLVLGWLLLEAPENASKASLETVTR
jgi:hypothetical protein